MKSRIILYAFSFSHHGRFSSFNRILNYLPDVTVVDTTFGLSKQLPQRVSLQFSRIWQELNEFRLLKYYKQSTPRVIHYMFPENSLFRGSRWKGHHRLVLSCHQPEAYLNTMMKNEVYAGYFKGLQSADVVVALSDSVVDAYKAVAPAARIFSIPHGVDVDFFRPSYEVESEPIILTLGNWLRDLDTWSEVVRIMLAEEDKARFILLANPDTLEQAKNKLGAGSQRVVFLSGISDYELRDLYQKSRIVFLPLVDGVANNSVLEALASGLPLVVTDLPATREYVGQDAGIFVGKEDVRASVSALRMLLNEPAACQMMGEMGRSRAEQYFSWRVIASQYRRLYQDLGL